MRTTYEDMQIHSNQLSNKLSENLEKDNINNDKYLNDFIESVVYRARVFSREDKADSQDRKQKLRENIAEQLKTFGGTAAWVHAGGSLGVQLVASGLGFAGNAATTAVSAVGTATDKIMGVHSEEKSGRRNTLQFEKEMINQNLTDIKENIQHGTGRVNDGMQALRQVANSTHDAASKILS